MGNGKSLSLTKSFPHRWVMPFQLFPLTDGH
jgi:hypothetical protein